LAYAGLETGVKTEHPVLKQDKIRIVLTTPLTQDSPIHEHLKNMVMSKSCCFHG
jgi:4-hydroxyphenylpyruvate dioxygenase